MFDSFEEVPLSVGRVWFDVFGGVEILVAKSVIVVLKLKDVTKSYHTISRLNIYIFWGGGELVGGT